MSLVPGEFLYRGEVLHKRLKPFTHELTYSVFSILIDIDRLAELSAQRKLFGHNHWAPISVHDKDYGRRDGSPIRDWVNTVLKDGGYAELIDQPVRLLTFPRLWGYVFNPLSIYYCYRADGALGAILYEVSNTFGESHGYLIPVENTGTDNGAVHQETAKVFHVSPFIEMDCRYRFSLMPPSEKLSVVINQSDSADDPIIVAKHTAKGQPLTDRALFSALLRHPLMTAKVMGGIHWEALKLWLKGARFYGKPPAPAQHITR